ncbi:MAG: succinylglutamate desuccinylase/aspartoacylase family protein [Flavobacteriales bacterium]|nr:succinylglutamate desuccinylase/aspartoacylase family protein [Flavobacteriales bacterium]
MNQKLEADLRYKRIIYKPNNPDPNRQAIVFTGGIHGNEPAGYTALESVLSNLEQSGISLQGDVYAFGGNLKAMEANKRFLTIDLNRLWTKKLVHQFKTGEISSSVWGEEIEEFAELLSEIEHILQFYHNKVIFIDLHTTSSKSVPFIPINDTLSNRSLALNFPVPTVLGIEEFIDGPLLSYINEVGHVALGIEAGQHEDPRSADIHASFIRLCLHFTRTAIVPASRVQQDLAALKAACPTLNGIYEIWYRYAIQPNEKFRMTPGYSSFSEVHAGQELAVSEGKRIFADRATRVFMPLYQEQGEDGYYLIRKVSKRWLLLSAWLRKSRIEVLFAALPGVHRTAPDTLVINRYIARFMSKEISHLFGYRIQSSTQSHLLITKRDLD